MPAKGSPRGKGKKLTDFFGQKPLESVSAPVSATSSRLTGITTTMPTTRRRPATRTSRVTVDRKSCAPPRMRSVSAMATRKRPRSPDSNDPNMSSLRPLKSMSPKKPTKMFKFDSDSEKAVICITSSYSTRNSSSQRSTPVQARNDTPVASPLASSEQIVYSSQSDEAELVLPIPQQYDLERVVNSVHVWRRKASESSNSSASRVREDATEVDLLPSSLIRSSPTAPAWSASPHLDAPVRSPVMSSDNAAFRTPVITPPRLPSSPDINKLPPLPPTPVPIDPETKAAKLIAEIKARAFAANQSSDGEQPLSFRELEDSDDGDLIDDLRLIGDAKRQRSVSPVPRTAGDVLSSPLSSMPTTPKDAIIGPRTRRAPDRNSPPLRLTRASVGTRRLAPAFHVPRTIAESSTSVGVAKSVSFPLNRKKSQVTNPLRVLLREKELEDKRGVNCAALRLAEEATRQSICEWSAGSDGEFNTVNLNRSHLADEQAAWKAVHESCQSTSPVGPSDVEDFTIGERESKMLGAAAGEAINKILVGDKNGNRRERVRYADQEVGLDVTLWIRPSDDDMEVDFMPILPLSGHPILAYLDGFLKSGDDSTLDLILRTGALAVVPRDVLLSNIPQILDIALFASSQVTDAIFIALRDLWGSNPPKVQMSFAAISFALVRLGASPLVLEKLGLHMDGAQQNRITYKTFLKALKKLLAIMKIAGFAGAFSSDDLINVVLILVVMGLDPLTLSELRTQLNITVDVVCNRGVTDCLLRGIHEKVLSLTSQLAPANKARVVSLFASGSGRTRCIARHLAYCLLVSSSITPSGPAPPLEPLILLLSPDVGSCELFDVTSESTNYEELRHHINILSVALVDIAPYIEEERAITKSTSSNPVQGSPNKSKKPVSPLEVLRSVLDTLQSRIVDTRATHLDRSRTKAAIQRLTMRIYFDRMARIGVRLRPRAATLNAYFSPQRQ